MNRHNDNEDDDHYNSNDEDIDNDNDDEDYNRRVELSQIGFPLTESGSVFVHEMLVGFRREGITEYTMTKISEVSRKQTYDTGRKRVLSLLQ